MSDIQDQLTTLFAECKADLNTFRHKIQLYDSEKTEKLPPAYYHKQWAEELISGTSSIACEGYRECGKAQHIDTLIPTPYGYKTIAELKIGDFVFGSNGKQTKVIGKSPVFTDHNCYKVYFSDGTDNIADAGHLWVVNDKKNRSKRVYNTEYMYKNFGGWNHKNGYKERRYTVSLCSPVEYKEKQYTISPYVLGYWLGNGHSMSSSITCGLHDIDYINQRILSEKETYTARNSIKNNAVTKTIKNLLPRLREINVLDNKHIPDVYKQGSIKQRRDLIEGLIDSDGYISSKRKGTVEFSSSIKDLAEDFIEVVRGLGYKATIRSKQAKIYGVPKKITYTISFKPHASDFFFNPRKQNNLKPVSNRSRSVVITKIEPIKTVKTQCIVVDNDDHTYLYGKEYRITHNSSIIKAFLLYCLTYPQKNRSYIGIMRGNKTAASKIVKEISAEYQRNLFMKASIGTILEDSAEAFCVEAYNGIVIRIEAYGKGSAIRGANYANRRPDIVILDDIQDKEEMRSETIPETDWDWFLSDIKFLGKQTRFFMIGNNLGEKCIIERLINTADENGTGLFGFKCYRVPAIVNDVPVWKERFSLDYLVHEREEMTKQGKLDIWLMERMCIAVSEETRTFKTEWIKRYDYNYFKELKQGSNIYCTLDPASSKKDTSCYRAFVVFSVNSKNQWHILHIEYGRWDSAELMDKMFDIVKEWRVPEIGIEKGHYQQVIEPFLIKEMSRRNVYFTVKPLEHAKIGSKLERIKMLAPKYKAGDIFHPIPSQCSWVSELEAEMAGVTKDGIKSEYIDLVDALSMGMQVADVPIDTSDTEEYNDIVGRELHADNEWIND